LLQHQRVAGCLQFFIRRFLFWRLGWFLLDSLPFLLLPDILPRNGLFVVTVMVAYGKGVILVDRDDGPPVPLASALEVRLDASAEHLPVHLGLQLLSLVCRSCANPSGHPLDSDAQLAATPPAARAAFVITSDATVQTFCGGSRQTSNLVIPDRCMVFCIH
jgi:hypothetical protein